MGTLNRLAKILREESPTPPLSVRVTQEGLEVVRAGETLASVRWCDVTTILAYKYDLFTTDEICVGFLTSPDADSWLEISEEWRGFREATDKMDELFPGIPRKWYSAVMVPGFERKETVLWQCGPAGYA